MLPGPGSKTYRPLAMFKHANAGVPRFILASFLRRPFFLHSLPSLDSDLSSSSMNIRLNSFFRFLSWQIRRNRDGIGSWERSPTGINTTVVSPTSMLSIGSIDQLKASQSYLPGIRQSLSLQGRRAAWRNWWASIVEFGSGRGNHCNLGRIWHQCYRL